MIEEGIIEPPEFDAPLFTWFEYRRRLSGMKGPVAPDLRAQADSTIKRMCLESRLRKPENDATIEAWQALLRRLQKEPVSLEVGWLIAVAERRIDELNSGAA
ncbi:MAG: hypothetical protein ACREC3_05915 [Methyloceanibacter sp.]